MPTIKCEKDFQFSEDGLTVTTFKAGEEYDVTDLCAAYAAKVGALDNPGPDKPESEELNPQSDAADGADGGEDVHDDGGEDGEKGGESGEGEAEGPTPPKKPKKGGK